MIGLARLPYYLDHGICRQNNPNPDNSPVLFPFLASDSDASQYIAIVDFLLGCVMISVTSDAPLIFAIHARIPISFYVLKEN